MLPSCFSRVRPCATPWTAAFQASPSLGFSRQEHWSGLPFPSPMHESGKWKWSHSVVSNSATPWTAAYQAPPSMGFSGQQYWSGVPLPSPHLKHNSLSIMENFCPLYPQQLPHTPFNFFPRNLIQYVLLISLFMLYTWHVLSLLLFVPHSESLLIFIPLQNFSIIFFKTEVYLIFKIYLFSSPTLLCSFYCALLISYIFNSAFNSLLICLNQIILLAELIACLILVFILSAESCFLIWFSHAFFLEPGYVLQCISSFQNPVTLKLKAFLC